MSLNMLDQSSYARHGLPMPEGVSPGFSSALQGDFLGLSLPEEENHWGLSPISPWNSKHEQAFNNPNLERDFNNSRVRNGQPTPPPYDDTRASQDFYPPLPQYHIGASPPTFPDHGHRRSYSEHSGYEDDQSYAGSSSNSNKRRRTSRSSAIDFDDSHPDRAKREKFLERNRLAASKCRQKKKEHTQLLETRYKEQSDKKELLVSEIARLRHEILGLKNEVLRHAQCGDEPIKLHLAQMVKKITYNDTSTTAVELSDAADAVSTSEEPSTPTAQQQPQQSQQQGVMSFGFDDALQPAVLEQQMRRDSEASLVSHPFSSSEDNFDDLINV